jgi:hypothetical protein
MQQIEHTYCDLVRQSIRIKGVIKNTTKGLIVNLSDNKISKEELVLSFLKCFRSNYDIYPDKYNLKEYKNKFLKEKILEKEKELEDLKFAYKICGRKILKEDI